jgi:hypothetical protein
VIPGIKVVHQTSHQAHVIAQNEFVLNKLRSAAIKEATTAWVEASELKEKGEPHKTKKEVLQMINNKPEYKDIVKVCERTIRCLVSEGIIGVSPPCRGNPGIPNESRKGNQLIQHLRKDFGPEISLGKAEKVEERQVKWTTYNNLKTWGNTAKDILIELGFGRESTPHDNVPGEIYFYVGQLERIVNFDETRITLDQTDVQRGGRPSFIFYKKDKPRPGSSTTLSLTLIVGGTAAGEIIPPHFQLTTDGQNEELQVWNTSLIRYMHHIFGRFGYDGGKYHPFTFGMNDKGGMTKDEFEEYLKNSVVTLYPDAADAPGKRVLLKADSGPGRKNTDLMAYLRVRGFYFLPGLPNSTHVTQEMELHRGG